MGSVSALARGTTWAGAIELGEEIADCNRHSRSPQVSVAYTTVDDLTKRCSCEFSFWGFDHSVPASIIFYMVISVAGICIRLRLRPSIIET